MTSRLLNRIYPVTVQPALLLGYIKILNFIADNSLYPSSIMKLESGNKHFTKLLLFLEESASCRQTFLHSVGFDKLNWAIPWGKRTYFIKLPCYAVTPSRNFYSLPISVFNDRACSQHIISFGIISSALMQQKTVIPMSIFISLLWLRSVSNTIQPETNGLEDQ